MTKKGKPKKQYSINREKSHEQPQSKETKQSAVHQPKSAEAKLASAAATVTTTSPDRESMPSSTEKISFGIKKIAAIVIFIAAICIYLYAWTDVGDPVVDPWFAAVQLVDSSRKVDDPQLKHQLLERGGDELRYLTAKFPYHARVHFLLGYYYSTAAKWDSSIAEYKEAIRIGAGGYVNQVEFIAMDYLTNAAISWANELLQKRDFAQARKTIDEALVYKPKEAALNSMKGIIYHNLGQLDSAIACYSVSLEANPQNPDIHFNRAVAYLNKGQFQLAKADFQKTLEQNPNHEGARKNLAYLSQMVATGR